MKSDGSFFGRRPTKDLDHPCKIEFRGNQDAQFLVATLSATVRIESGTLATKVTEYIRRISCVPRAKRSDGMLGGIKRRKRERVSMMCERQSGGIISSPFQANGNALIRVLR